MLDKKDSIDVPVQNQLFTEHKLFFMSLIKLKTVI